MLRLRIFVICIWALLTYCHASPDTCSNLNIMEQLLEKMIRTETNFGQLKSNVEGVHTKMSTALDSAVNQIETLESKVIALGVQDVAGQLKNINEQLNSTQAVTARLAELEKSVSSKECKDIHGVESRDVNISKGATCPDEWTSFKGSCYLFGQTDHSFPIAESFCEGLGGYLVNIETQEENNFLRGQLRQRNALKYWVGTTDEAQEGVWRFVPSGTRIMFTDWGTNQPNNYRVSNCMAIWKSFGFLWVDEPCTNEFKPICERRCVLF